MAITPRNVGPHMEHLIEGRWRERGSTSGMGVMEIVEDRKGEGKVSRRAVVVKAVVRASRKEEAGKEDHPRAKGFKAFAFNATKQGIAVP